MTQRRLTRDEQVYLEQAGRLRQEGQTESRENHQGHFSPQTEGRKHLCSTDPYTELN
ncbi:Uncharacterized protein DAT39_021863 [Clarias magur]|uniref:Uncharacterized protein n=1 Tax=Clarias magur TaxID=1594786 RepID=A0A8J4WRY1_CLAMG|nr:Uncharacterized protein DAT39_021863 [Clarias magur]